MKATKTSQDLAPVTPKYPDLLLALTLRQKGLSIREISAQIGIPPSTLQGHFKRLAGLLDTPYKLQAYESGRANLLSAAEAVYLDAVVQADLSRASAKDKAIVYGILYDKGRLERGKATAHIAVLAGLVAHADKVMFPGQAVVLHKDNTPPVVDIQPVDGDTPSPPIPGGTGGLDDSKAAVDLHDPEVLQSDPLPNEIIDIDELETFPPVDE